MMGFIDDEPVRPRRAIPQVLEVRQQTGQKSGPIVQGDAQKIDLDASIRRFEAPQNRFRIFYEVNAAERSVVVLAIGVKEKNQLFIGGKEFVP